MSGFFKGLLASTSIMVTSATLAQSPPTLTLNGNLLPCISHNINTALSKGLPFVLQRDSVDSQRKRDQSCGLLDSNIQEFNRQDDMIYACSEYPFSSTSAGGVGAQVMLVPMKEQQIHNGLLLSFFKQHRVKHGGHFIVQVMYAGTRINNLNTTHLSSPSVPGMVLKCN